MSTVKLSGLLAVQPEVILCLILSMVSMVVLHLFMNKTKLGTAMRASSMDSMAAFEKVAVPSEYNKVEYFSNVKPDLFKDVVNKFMSHESMNMSKPEGEHAAHDGMEGMDMSHAETAH